MEQIEALCQELKKRNIDFLRDEPLSKHTSFRIGGPARVFCTPKNSEKMAETVGLCRQHGVRYYLLGKGSNVLFSDAGFDGAVLNTAAMAGAPRFEGTTVYADAGLGLNTLCKAAAAQGLSGLEFAFGIPGSVGGAVYMNAGAYGGEMRDVLTAVTFLDETGTVRTLPAEELELGYRTSIFERTGWHVLSAQLHLVPGDPAQIEAAMQELMARRVEKQPLEYPSAGSAFKRPQGAFAGALIQQCGLRGARVGGAAISEKHCGFIVNLGGATCADVLALADLVCKTVKEQTGYTLEKEIRVVE